MDDDRAQALTAAAEHLLNAISLETDRTSERLTRLEIVEKALWELLELRTGSNVKTAS